MKTKKIFLILSSLLGISILSNGIQYYKYDELQESYYYYKYRDNTIGPLYLETRKDIVEMEKKYFSYQMTYDHLKERFNSGVSISIDDFQLREVK